MEYSIYDHYIAIDWSMKNMSIARMTKKSNKITVVDVASDIFELRIYLKNLEGAKILVIEETTTSQWLYTELKDYVEELVVCDPYRNKLLNEGTKTDKIDACKLVQLLKAGLIKKVYHSSDRFLYLRKVVSGYEDLVKAGVRLRNQRSALFRSCGKEYDIGNKGDKLNTKGEQFVLECLERQIKSYETEKKSYEDEFKRLSKKHVEIRNQRSLPGVGVINAVKIVSRVVSPYRFEDRGHYLSYVGLIKLEKISGGRSYGRKNSRYCRQLKSVYKTSTMAAIGGNNEINDLYEHLIRRKNYTEYNARHKVCRRLAILSLGVFRSGKKYNPHRRKDVTYRQGK